MKSLVSLTTNYFKKYGAEIPNPALIHDIINKLKANQPGIEDSVLFPEIVIELRTEYGYYHPIEEAADLNDARPYLSNKNFRKLKEGD